METYHLNLLLTDTLGRSKNLTFRIYMDLFKCQLLSSTKTDYLRNMVESGPQYQGNGGPFALANINLDF